MIEHRFGGNWTQEKLSRLDAYIKTYLTVLKNQSFKKTYLDAFAGSGSVFLDDTNPDLELFDTQDRLDFDSYVKGSAQVALEQPLRFDSYEFIEKSPELAGELARVVRPYVESGVDVQIRQGDCNQEIQKFCDRDWSNQRALVFLDPYGTQLSWSTLEALSRTRAVDVLLLIPYAVAYNRLMKNSHSKLGQSWRDRLNQCFGTDEWERECYRKSGQMMIGGDEEMEKIWREEDVLRYYLQRMKTVFPFVHDEPYIMTSSRNRRLFALGFACANPSSAATDLAKRLVSSILR